MTTVCIDNDEYVVPGPMVVGRDLYSVAGIDHSDSVLVMDCEDGHHVPVEIDDFMLVPAEHKIVTMSKILFDGLKQRAIAPIVTISINEIEIALPLWKINCADIVEHVGLVPEDHSLYIYTESGHVQINMESNVIVAHKMEFHTQTEKVDLRNYTDKSKPPPSIEQHGSYLIYIDGTVYEHFESSISSDDILDHANINPEDWVAFKCDRYEGEQIVSPNTEVDLLIPGLSGFVTRKKIEYFTRDYKLSKEEEDYLNDNYAGLWETKIDPSVLIIHEFPVDFFYNKKFVKVLVELPLSVESCIRFYVDPELKFRNDYETRFSRDSVSLHGEEWGFSEWGIVTDGEFTYVDDTVMTWLPRIDEAFSTKSLWHRGHFT